MSEIINMSITNKCNFNCKHCVRDEKNFEEMDFNTFKRCLDFFDNIEQVNLTGGEILVHSQLDLFLEELVKRNIKFSFVTNGFLLKRFDKIIKNYKKDIEKIGLSLESSNEKLNDFIRRKGSYKKVIQGLKLTKEYQIPTRIMFTINKLNYSEIFDMFLLSKKYNALLVTAPIRPTRSNKEMVMDESKFKNLNELILKISSLIKKGNWTLNWDVNFKNVLCRELCLIENVHAIDCYGNLRLCCDLFDSKNKKFDYYGNIKNNSYDSYMSIKRKKVQKMLKNFKKKNIKNGSFCSECYKTNMGGELFAL